MKLVNRPDLENYLNDDEVIKWLEKYSEKDDDLLVCQQWLRSEPAKRYIFHNLYAELFIPDQRIRLLDIGGGCTSLTRKMITLHDYQLLDLLAHDSDDITNKFIHGLGQEFIQVGDWLCASTDGQYDLIIANDLFPNVDQRLEMFIEHFLPITARLKMSLTFYNDHRFYLTKRVDADEIMSVLAWDGNHLRYVLEKYTEHIVEPEFSIFENKTESVFSNGRQVCLIEFKGGLA